MCLQDNPCKNDKIWTKLDEKLTFGPNLGLETFPESGMISAKLERKFS